MKKLAVVICEICTLLKFHRIDLITVMAVFVSD